jgi:hypothetical protein
VGRKASDPDGDLMEAALAKAGKIVAAPGKQSARPEGLRPQEFIFVEAYLRNGGKIKAAAEAAEYAAPSEAGHKLMKRKVVMEAIGRRMREAAAGAIGQGSLAKADILEFVRRSMLDNVPFERLKGAELLLKALGHMAPTRHQHLHQTISANPYAQLKATLETSGARFTDEERLGMRAQLLADRAEIDELLAHLARPAGRVS